MIFVGLILNIQQNISLVKHTMSSNQIAIPSALLSDPHLFDKINTNNAKVYSHVEYIRQVVTCMHQMYNQLCKKILQVSDQYERKLVSSTKINSQHYEVILDFIRSISSLHYTLSNQLNSNTVTLGTKTHRIAKNRMDVLKERILQCKQINMEYSKSVQEFNSQEREFRKECQYFSDYQKDVLKFFSLKSNLELHQILQFREIKLKQKREDIFHKKIEYQQNVHECRVLIGDYFDLQRSIISQYSRLLLNVRRKTHRTTNNLYAHAIIEEPSNEMNTTTIRNQMPALTNHSERMPERSIFLLRKNIVREEERVKGLESILERYIFELEEAIKIAGDKIDDMRDESDYHKFISQKLVMLEILPGDTIRQIDEIVNEITLFRTIILNIQAYFGKLKVLKEIQKYRKYNYDKFLDQTANYTDLEKRGPMSSSMKSDYSRVETKFLARNAELSAKYRDRVVELQQYILNEYYREEVAYSENKNRKVVHNSIFVKAYYQTLADPFFLNKSNNNSTTIYKENPHLKKLSTHLSANQIQTTLTMNGFHPKKLKSKGKGKGGGCCGLFIDDTMQGEEQESSGIHSLIDDFHCSLKDGLVLIRGKLKLYENYISFISSFNSKTLFGYSDIRIPKWNILNMSLGKHLLSEKVTIETTHGNIQFTDFFCSPYELLVNTYETKKSGMAVFHHKNVSLHLHSDEDTEVAMLEQIFQSQFQGVLMNVGIIVDKLSTYLSEDKQKLSISTEYHLSRSSTHVLFEIKIIQKGIAIQYIFIHDQKCRSTETKNLLQQASKDLINRKSKQEPAVNTFKKIGRTSHFDCSIIEGEERNKLSFMKEPSFMQEKRDSIIDHSHSSFPQFLNSNNFLESSRNYDPDSKLSPPHSKRASSTQDFHEQLIQMQKVKFSVEDSVGEIREEPSKQVLESMHNKPKLMIGSGKSIKTMKSSSVPGSPMTVKSSKKRKEQSYECNSSNLKRVFYVIVAVVFLNILLKIFTP